jgi:hypothetical protein
MRWRMSVPSWESLTGTHKSCKRVVFRVRTGRPIRVNLPANFRTRCQRSKGTATKRSLRNIVNLSVNMLILPLAVNQTNKRREFGVIT